MSFKPRNTQPEIKAEAAEEKIESGFYDLEEIHHNCLVQVWRNSVTGEVSTAWKPEPNVSNADRIRAMGDEELAKFLAQGRAALTPVFFKDESYSVKDVSKWIGWLKQEAADE